MLAVQSTTDNHFGAYVVTGLNLYNVDGTIIRELLVKVYNGNRAFGDVEYGDNCSIRILRPRPCSKKKNLMFLNVVFLVSNLMTPEHFYTHRYDGAQGPWTQINGGGGDTSARSRVSLVSKTN